MDIKRIFRSALKSWYVFIVLTIFACSVSLMTTELFVEKKYESSGSVYFTPIQQDDKESEKVPMTEVINHYVELALSNHVLERTINENKLLKDKYTVIDLKKIIVVSRRPDTDILDITCVSKDAKESKNIILAFIDTSIPILKNMISYTTKYNCSFPDTPQEGKKIYPNTFLGIQLSVLASMFLFAAFIIIPIIFAPQIKSVEALESSFDAKVLVEIPNFQDKKSYTKTKKESSGDNDE